MIDPKIRKQPNPNIVMAPKSSPGKNAMMPDTIPSQETAKIRERAYELYEGRGRNPATTNRTGSAPSKRFSKEIGEGIMSTATRESARRREG